jgi:hypothetical protein
LNEHEDQKVTVINAGVSGYSSFQSLKYLELYGHRFQPDAVLFYHEVNDYLPTAVRGGSPFGEIGLLQTDKELYGSSLYRINAQLLELSHFYAWLSRAIARLRIEQLSASDPENPFSEIQLPDIQLPNVQVGRIKEIAADSESGVARRVVRSRLRPSAVGRRVSEAERLEILGKLVSWCAERDVQLILIHPAYRDSTRHQCVLTRFASQHRVMFLDAFDVLHPEGVDVDEMFIDIWHPTTRGHEALAQELAQLLANQVLPVGQQPGGPTSQ